MSDPKAYAVIMAGGSGTRFWPLSRNETPKQFLQIVGEDSMLKQTWDRCLALVEDPARVLVVTAARYADLTRAELPDLPEANLLAEPEARNTAPCLAWTAAELHRRDADSVMMVFPADHVIEDVEGLGRSVEAACKAAATGALVTFGVPPRYAETGYGYVEVGDSLEVESAAPVRHVVAFREKPDAATAQDYVAAGLFLWNSGMFVWRSATLIEAMSEHLPEAADAATRMLSAASDDDRAETYGDMPAISIDYGIMERASAVACVEAQFDWSDVGSWEALAELLPADADDNVVRGAVASLDASGNLVHAPGEAVALLGVENLAVVRAGDVLLVARLDRSQDIKALRDQVAAAGMEDKL
ncbi:MAG: NTP transferase domain-containing protein [Acidobacteria bacterium]|nr:NTP transferase domain-containing protein [Acidobacteriota bacterium]